MRALALISLLALGLSACASTPKELPGLEHAGYISNVQKAVILVDPTAHEDPDAPTKEAYISTLKTEEGVVHFRGRCEGLTEPSNKLFKVTLQDEKIFYRNDIPTVLPQRSLVSCGPLTLQDIDSAQ